MSTASSPPSGITSATALKIRIPRQPRGTVARPELEAVLRPAGSDADELPPVFLVTGPAGAGKTTLVSGWATGRQADEGVAWVTLDASDDVTALWSGILAAVRRAGVHPRPDAVARLVVPRDTGDSGFVAEVAELLAECRRPLWIVLDEIEHLTDPGAARSLDLMLRWAREPVRIVLVGRSEPPVALHRLRLNGRLVEIRGRDLAFSTEHTVELLAGHGVRLDDADLELLMGRTEGWVAGVRLAALALEGAAEPHRQLVDFAGDDRAVADFLVGEILARQPDDVREFMLRTSVCDEICPGLAMRLTGRDDAGAVLGDLVRRNALTVELGGHAGWYRYHPLFGSYLRAELERRSPSGARVLHGRAAGWFEEQGDPVRALDHAAAAGDTARIMGLTRRHGLGAVLAGRAAEVSRIIAAAPPDARDEPAVALVACAAALDRGRTDEADRWLGRLPDAELDPVAEALRAVLVLSRARIAGAYTAELAALDDTVAGSSGDRDLDLLALAERGLCRLWLARLDEAERDLTEAVTRAEADGRDHVALRSMTNLAAVSSARGDLVGTAGRSARAIDYAVPRGWSRSAECAHAYLLRGLSAYQQLDDERARRNGVLARELVGGAPDPTVSYTAAALELATRYEIAGDRYRAAVEAGLLWEELGTAHLAPALVAYAALPHHRMCMQVGELEHARRIAEVTRERLGDVGESRLLEGYAAVNRGRGQETRRRLQPVLDGRIACVVPTTLVAVWLLDAVLAGHAGETGTAHRCLVEALRIAEPIAALRPFADGGQAVRDLLAAGAGRFGHAEEFAARVREALRPGTTGAVDLLTVREREVLVELPSLRTAAEIAEDMFVSTNTVRTHMRSIYHKLGVPHRRAAVSEARLQGLL
ncbi:MAG: LuxR C-terminal-related transcriptional regulator [Pseudonocardia sp.]|nr:LuxR C-terminal-related transcriptional regulator [Pseudonocardia sp.]